LNVVHRKYSHAKNIVLDCEYYKCWMCYIMLSINCVDEYCKETTFNVYKSTAVDELSLLFKECTIRIKVTKHNDLTTTNVLYQ